MPSKKKESVMNLTGCAKRIVLPLILFIFMHTQPADGFDCSLTKQDKVMMTTLGSVAAVMVWGTMNWDYFDSQPKTTSEGWFSRNTDSGGADKLGHFHSSYTLSHLFSHLYEGWGYGAARAAGLGSFTSFAVNSCMEIGDSFSSYGFSHEDFVMNLLGSAAGYYFYSHPEMKKKIDFRVEYDLDFETIDVFTDYENHKYLVALKLAGFDGLKNTLAKYVELHFGYFTRGYDDTADKERTFYVGAGISIPEILKACSLDKVSTISNYLQLPHSYIPLERDLNR